MFYSNWVIFPIWCVSLVSRPFGSLVYSFGHHRLEQNPPCYFSCYPPPSTIPSAPVCWTYLQDLCIDVYDEAERRLTNSFLELLESPTSEAKPANGFSHPLPHSNGTRAADEREPKHEKLLSPALLRQLTLFFLPLNTAYTSIRNQARQKLGRLSTVEFHSLVLDILTEVSKRLLPLFTPVKASASEFLHHPYYPNDTLVAVPPRQAPLPSPPPTVDREVGAERTNASTLSVNESVVSEGGKSVFTTAEPSPTTPRGKIIGHTKRIDRDDPVYDQAS